ncbi:hypothetical protein Barb7_02933 [Bacteroidales bacterium Barb7]|nr:hypothetical protein Barb7_02933 [Bacteroidales bacterium Barb7]
MVVVVTLLEEEGLLVSSRFAVVAHLAFLVQHIIIYVTGEVNASAGKRVGIKGEVDKEVIGLHVGVVAVDAVDAEATVLVLVILVGTGGARDVACQRDMVVRVMEADAVHVHTVVAWAEKLETAVFIARLKD